MGLLDIFKKDKIYINSTSDNGVIGPAFLDGFTKFIYNPKDLLPQEWRRKLISTSGQTQFKIKYYGQLHNDYQNLIIGTDFAPPIVIAVDISYGEEILLFDGCKHGYNALFCDSFTEIQIKNRPVTNFYRDNEGNEIFEIVISTYNGIDFDYEFEDQIDENGLIKLLDGTNTEFENVKRNGFDTIQIWATNDKGKVFEIVSEETA